VHGHAFDALHVAKEHKAGQHGNAVAQKGCAPSVGLALAQAARPVQVHVDGDGRPFHHAVRGCAHAWRKDIAAAEHRDAAVEIHHDALRGGRETGLRADEWQEQDVGQDGVGDAALEAGHVALQALLE
jgi:hypothetical protein